MLPIPFPPGLYADVDWAFRQPVNLPDDGLKQIFSEARSRMLEELPRSYFNAVEIYGLPAHSVDWIERAPLQAIAREAGKIYVTLDHFAAGLPLPKQVKNLGARKEEIFGEYFSRRSLDNLQANAEALLKILGIASLIPDEWFPEESLKKNIKDQIQRAGLYRNIEIGLDLGIPPGGLRWLSETTQQAVTEVREKLAAGQPWPMRMIRSPGRLEGNRQVIVYACREEKDRLLLEIFEPDCVLEEHTLQLMTKKGRLEVKEIVGEDRSLPVLGLLSEAYSPAPPPLECTPWWLRWKGLRRAWMRMAT